MIGVCYVSFQLLIGVLDISLDARRPKATMPSKHHCIFFFFGWMLYYTLCQVGIVCHHCGDWIYTFCQFLRLEKNPKGFLFVRFATSYRVKGMFRAENLERTKRPYETKERLSLYYVIVGRRRKGKFVASAIFFLGLASICM